MSNREVILHKFDVIDRKYQQLKLLVDKSSDQELDNILGLHFSEYANNIITHFEFLQMIISNVDVKSATLDEEPLMTNKDLEEHFRNNWDLLISKCV